MFVPTNEKHTKLLFLSDICNKKISRVYMFCDNRCLIVSVLPVIVGL